MNEYTPTIGLEIHAQLKTRTKMFCSSPNVSDEKDPNVNICPVCMAHPGTLPVINFEAVKHVLKLGLAVGGELADYTEFDRKNYFYPDIPKGYQISQYEHPLVKGGSLAGVLLTRVHLEEDTARSIHGSALKLKESFKNTGDMDYSLVDFNRAGIPLMELVTEPVIKSAEEAGKFARELQLLLRSLDISDANMEKGEMRVEANVSVSKTDALGTKTEVKNINSFRAAEKAIAYEIERQIKVLENGEEVMQETRGWDDSTSVTFSQRKKEESHDYRYFPDPDLPKLHLNEVEELSEENLKKEMPELPWEMRERLKKSFGIKDEDMEVFLADTMLRTLFEETVRGLKDKKEFQLASNYITSDLVGLLKADPKIYLDSHLPFELKIRPEEMRELIEMVSAGELSSRGAKDVLSIMYEDGGNPKDIAEKKELLQKSDLGDLEGIVENIISSHLAVAEDFRSGNEKVLQFLVGQGMKESKGSANPQVLAELFRKKLND
jgi:aspartyl-tRNA(Asn)/glutamyl-tRNA(Gln) amidotransferase subunit B